MIGLVLAVMPVGAAWLPLVSRSTVTSDGANPIVQFSDSHESLIDAQGWTVVIPLLLPVVVTLVPVLLRRRPSAQPARVWAAVLLGIGVGLAVASVGMLYVPALSVLVAAVVVGFYSSLPDLEPSSPTFTAPVRTPR